MKNIIFILLLTTGCSSIRPDFSANNAALEANDRAIFKQVEDNYKKYPFLHRDATSDTIVDFYDENGKKIGTARVK